MRASRTKSYVAALALLALAATSCKTLDPLVVSGRLLSDIGEEFVSVATLFEQAHDSKLISDEKFMKFAQFGMKFQAAYPAAVHLWRMAVITNDDLLKNQAAQIIADLSGPLAEFANEIYGVFGKPQPQSGAVTQ